MKLKTLLLGAAASFALAPPQWRSAAPTGM